MASRVCRYCGVEYPITEFRKGRYQCRLCKNKAQLEYISRNKEKERERKRAWYIANPNKYKEQSAKWKAKNPSKSKEYNLLYRRKNGDKINARIKGWKMNNPEMARESHYKRKYNLGSEEHDRLFVKQDGRCAICGTDQCELKMPLYIDHDHKTGEVRGLLCRNCNTMIGLSYDNRDIMLSAANYLSER